MENNILNLKVGESIVLELPLDKSKEHVASLKTTSKYKFVYVSKDKTTVVRVSNGKTIHSKIIEELENGNIYAGCFIPGNPYSVRNSVFKVNSLMGTNIKFKIVGGLSYLIEDLSLMESITLDQYKKISFGFEKKLEDLQKKIIID